MWDEIQDRPTDRERQDAFLAGTGGYGGEDNHGQPELRQDVAPSTEA